MCYFKDSVFPNDTKPNHMPAIRSLLSRTHARMHRHRMDHIHRTIHIRTHATTSHRPTRHILESSPPWSTTHYHVPATVHA